jgi:hypothetical protein
MNDNEKPGRTDFIEQLWKSYVTSCYDGLPTDSQQYIEMRMSFYSGAIAFSHVLRKGMELGHRLEVALGIMEDEVIDFVKDVEAQSRK